jgi:hypothetical protein
MGDLLRFGGAQRGLHGANMVGRSAATASDELGSGLEELACEAGHVFRRAQIYVASIDGARHSGVGHSGQRQTGGGCQTFEGGKNGSGSCTAVDADRVCAPCSEPRGGDFRRRAVEAIRFLVHGDHGKDRKVGSDLTRGRNSLLGFIQRDDGFDDQQIDAHSGTTGGESANLFGEGSARLVEAGLSQWFQMYAERAN